MKDPQQQRLYAAEDVPATPTMSTVAQVQAYVDKVLARAYVRRTYGAALYERGRLPLRITVLDGRMRRSACATHTAEHGAVIRMPRWSRSEQCVLHEIAHHVRGTSQGGHHGPEFAKVYLDLVRHMLGAEEAAKLQARFRVHKVRVNDKNGSPRLPIVPPALKEYAAARQERVTQDREWVALWRAWDERFWSAAGHEGEVDCPVCGEWAPATMRIEPWRRWDDVEVEMNCRNDHYRNGHKRIRKGGA